MKMSHLTINENLVQLLLTTIDKHQKSMEKATETLQDKIQLMQDKVAELEFINAMLSDKLTLAQKKRIDMIFWVLIKIV